MVKKMNKIIFIICIFLNILSFSYINIYPTEFNERIDNDGVYKTFKLYNSTSNNIRYRIYVEDNEELENSMKNFIEIYPKSITLNPLEEKEFKIFVKAPENSKNGKYSAKLVVKEIEIPSNEKLENTNKFLTIFKLKMTGYVGEKENLKINKDIINFKDVIFFDTFNNNIIYSDKNNTYIINENLNIKKLNYYIIDKIDKVYIFKKDNKYGLIDKNFSEIIFGYENIFNSSTYGIYFAYNGENYGAIDENGKIAIPFIFDYIFPFKSNYSLVFKNNKFGLIDKRGNFLLEPLFEEIYYSSNGNYIIKKDDKYIDSNNKILKIDKIFPTLGDYPVYEKDEKLGIIDLYNQKIIDNKYSEISLDIDNGIILSNKNKYSLININDFLYNQKIEYLYNYVYKLSENIYAVSDDDSGLEKIINIKYRDISSEKYKEIIKINNNIFYAKKENKIDIYTTKNMKIKDINFKDIIYTNNSYIILNKDDKYYEIINILEDR